MQLHETTLSRFNHQHRAIKRYIDHLPPQGIYKTRSGGHSIHETVAYLARYHAVFYERLNRMLEEVDPFFELYRTDRDTEYTFSVARTTGALLHELYRVRQDIVQLLSDLDDGKSSRTATHASMGRMDLSQWIEFFLLQESNQLFRIFRLAGRFWSEKEHEDREGMIYLPELNYELSELAS